ncbi:3-deoxy-manno-octulosonate-8-phosphatase KdsC [Alteromonas sp. ASW11-36]|uniref:3-deoxy-D-manno-octulosonate 8-phosphate phosphatase KdsC n=1 Tax=Alteromonas arenosi TaxID=3055817 RepID=A0ABT7STC9_9ALTE|nr:3-deoxy-manno-octulosonate-8-phosphatase KdsC [Alteromonas sp. ASW11-36]MDM7859452.1 3-deoxy-manno-octulosonate-8-phosphatase KdsC [Alteromonas sp. ASW11-36]
MASIQTIYGELDEAIFASLKQIKLLVCDIDGVFSDGRIYLGNNGEELKAFHTRDGFGFKAVKKVGIKTAVITGRQSAIVTKRMGSLQTDFIIQGREDKKTALQALLVEQQIEPEEVLAMGDDVPDLGMFALAGVKVAVADAHPSVVQKSNWQTTVRGGFGAVREVCDMLLQANNRLDDYTGSST